MQTWISKIDDWPCGCIIALVPVTSVNESLLSLVLFMIFRDKISRHRWLMRVSSLRPSEFQMLFLQLILLTSSDHYLQHTLNVKPSIWESPPPRLTPWIRKRWIALSRFGVRSCPKHLGMLMKIMALFCSSVWIRHDCNSESAGFNTLPTIKFDLLSS